MNAPNDNTAAKGLRGWWQSPQRPGLQRLINPWEFRHLRAFGLTRIVLDYLWGKPAQQAIPALLTARSDRSRELNWIQIGSVAGPAMELPSAALRSANFRLQGRGQGSVSPRAYLAELPSLVAEITAGTIAVTATTMPLADVEQIWPQAEAPGERTVLVP